MPESMWVPFDFPSTSVGPMANAGEVPKCLRWGHAEALCGFLLVFFCLEVENEPTAALVQHHVFAGQLGFWQGWTATLGAHNARYVNPNGRL